MWTQVPKQDRPPRPMRAAVPTVRVPRPPQPQQPPKPPVLWRAKLWRGERARIKRGHGGGCAELSRGILPRYGVGEALG